MWAQQTIVLQNVLNNTNYFKILLKLQEKENGNSEGKMKESTKQNFQQSDMSTVHVWLKVNENLFKYNTLFQ